MANTRSTAKTRVVARERSAQNPRVTFFGQPASIGNEWPPKPRLLEWLFSDSLPNGVAFGSRALPIGVPTKRTVARTDFRSPETSFFVFAAAKARSISESATFVLQRVAADDRRSNRSPHWNYLRMSRNLPADHEAECRFATVFRASSNLGWRRLCLSCSQ
jgi:hypothetical protein